VSTTLSIEVLSKYKNEIFCETGTLWGEAIDVAIQCGFKKIYSIELDKEKVSSAQKKFSQQIEDGLVFIIEGDSSVVFPDLVKKLQEPTTFWLDAHWDGGPQGQRKCPLLDELGALLAHPLKNHSLLIDDRRLLGKRKSNWGKDVSEKDVVDLVKKINPQYKIVYEDGHIEDDIIAASL
jgi:hypothetical protein